MRRRLAKVGLGVLILGALTMAANYLLVPMAANENRWGPFEGRVVDADTGEAIPGAAVIVFWMRTIPNPAGEAHRFYDARWGVSTSDGRFMVPRVNPPWFKPFMTGAYLSCVAPGYLPYEFTPSDETQQGSRLRRGPLTLRVRRVPDLTREERLRRWRELSADNLLWLPHPMFEKFTSSINRKRVEMGQRPIRLLSGEAE